MVIVSHLFLCKKSQGVYQILSDFFIKNIISHKNPTTLDFLLYYQYRSPDIVYISNKE